MPALLPLRADLASGDCRSLYLGWLAGAQASRLDDKEREPPLPPGLGRLSASLQALAEFLRLDADLLSVAAAGSPDLPPAPPLDDLELWIAGLPVSEKDALLIQLAKGNGAHLGTELLGRFYRANAPPSDPTTPAGRRTLTELRSAAEEPAELRRRQEDERKAVEQARREREQAAARASYLDTLVGREDELWRQTEALNETKGPRNYDRAVQLLTDLHDLSAGQASGALFAARLNSLRERYASRPSLRERLDRAGLKA